MTSDQQLRPRRHTRVWLALSVLAILLILIFVPPLVSIARYKNRVTEAISTSLHRPVRLSSVELRILPRPGFVLTDFTVQEDPVYGYEPVLHANTVMAYIRLSSLWRGKLQISRISVDEASLNIVHAANGRWNVEALFQTAASLHNSGPDTSVELPYMVATNSRVNVKNGIKKLPFSLVNADASLWQEGGTWRVRVRAQPARTDVSLDLADTGILRAEAVLKPAARLEEIPLRLDVDWRQAQLGQLSRLLFGSDEGWRGDLTGEVHVDGTPQSAKVVSRLRAAGVHRAEFAPAAPVDFDATCLFTLHATTQSYNDILCNSPVGQGRARLTGNIPANESPNLTLEFDRVPVQGALDALRTMRRDVDESLDAAGVVSGKISYQQRTAPAPALGHPGHNAKPAAPPSPLTGTFSIDGLRLSSDNLSAPIVVPKVTLEPAPSTPVAPASLFANVTLIAGASSPIAVNAGIGLKGFHIALHGPASLARVRDFAHLAGVPADALSDVIDGTAVVNLSSEAQWISEPKVTLATIGAVPQRANSKVDGTIVLREATWKASFLPSPVTMSSATLQIDNDTLRWDPVAFTYGTVKGTATLELPRACAEPETCPPAFTAHLDSLSAADLQALLAGSRGKGTLLSSVLARFKSSNAGQWPQIKGGIQVDALALDPFTLKDVRADLRFTATGTEVSAFEGKLLGGTVNGTASLEPGNKPGYTVKATFTEFNPQQVAQLIGQRWSGGTISGDADLTMNGLTSADLGASAKGTLHFDWRNGAAAASAPAALARFDRWTGEAAIANGEVALGNNDAQRGNHKTTVQATVKLGTPAKLTFANAPAEHASR